MTNYLWILVFAQTRYEKPDWWLLGICRRFIV